MVYLSLVDDTQRISAWSETRVASKSTMVKSIEVGLFASPINETHNDNVNEINFGILIPKCLVKNETTIRPDNTKVQRVYLIV